MKEKAFWCLVAALLSVMVLAGSAGAAIPNHFVSTDGDSNIVDVNFNGAGLTSGWYFGVFDYGGSPDSGLNLVHGCVSDCFQSTTFVVDQTGSGNYEIRITETTDSKYISQGSTLNIGNSPDFSFYFWDGSSTFYDTDFNIGGERPTYSFSSNVGGGNVIGVDLAAVPIPGSSVLLLSGLIGLIAIGRRQSKN